VLRKLNLVSLPSVRKMVTREELGRILVGKRANNIGGAGLGEVLIVRVDGERGAKGARQDTFMEGWEAWRAGLGGEIVCRAG